MTEIRSADGRYLAVAQDDQNLVVYLAATMTPLWDRKSYEAGLGVPAPQPPNPKPPTPNPHPSPGAGRVIRVTDDRDGELVPRMYAYWANAVLLADRVAVVFAGHVDGAPRFFKVDLASGEIERLGPRTTYTGTAEGWYWDAEGWMYLCDGPRLRRVNPFTGEDRIVCDISESHPGCDLWQAHSADDGRTHSATVRGVVGEGGAYRKIGTVVFYKSRLSFFPAIGVLDESQVTRDGRFVVIKEDTGTGDDNRIIDLETGATRLVRDRDRAVGHSDCGGSLLIGEADKPDPGMCVAWDLTQPLTPERAVPLFPTTNMGYVSYRAGVCLHSGETHLSRVALDGSGLTPIVAHGNTGSEYDDRVKANLSPCGRVACYMSNAAGRRDVYLLVL